MKESFTVSR